MTHMNDAVLHRLRKIYDNPVKHFVDFEISSNSLADEQKKIDAMNPDEREAYLSIPENYRIGVKPEYIGLINVLTVATDMAYEIGNNIPNNDEKAVALGLLDKLCEFVVKASKPEEKNG